MTVDRQTNHHLSNLRDESVRRAARLEVVQELADELAHDLNNVLTVIAGSLQLYLLQHGPETAQHHFVRNAITAAERGVGMTGQLLAFASPQVVEVRDIDLHDVVAAVAPLVRDCLGSVTALVITPPPAALRPQSLRVVADGRFIASTLLALAQLIAAKGLPIMQRRLSIDIEAVPTDDIEQRSGAVDASGRFVALNVRCLAGVTVEVVRGALTPAFGTDPASRPLLDLSAAYASLRQCGGDIGVVPMTTPLVTGGSPGDGCVVTLLLPAAPDRSVASS